MHICVFVKHYFYVYWCYMPVLFICHILLTQVAVYIKIDGMPAANLTCLYIIVLLLDSDIGPAASSAKLYNPNSNPNPNTK